MATDFLVRPRRRPRRLRARPGPTLSVTKILVWVDAYFERTGKWPTARAGRVGDAWDTTWKSLDKALRVGSRGLRAGSSLARLLSERRGVRNCGALPPYSVSAILGWADAHRVRTGRWPNHESGAVMSEAGETWGAVESALRAGTRGLPGGSSLAQLLTKHRGARNPQALPNLTVTGILRWADAHHKRTGRWPTCRDGAIPESAEDNWWRINAALRNGYRSLPGGMTLARLLEDRRGARNHLALATLSFLKILKWADAHRKRTGKWPKLNSGPILEAPGETWLAINTALHHGTRGLPGGSSLAKLLQRRRGVRHKQALPNFRVREILAWAHAHRLRTGEFPLRDSGRVAESPGDTWLAVEMALRKGQRGLSGSSTLAKLLKALRRVPLAPIPSGPVPAISRRRRLATKATRALQKV